MKAKQKSLELLQRQGWARSKEWYKIRAADGIPEIFIFDAIDIFGVDAEQFIKDLNQISAPKLRLRINSPGGNVFDGAAMISAIKGHSAHVEARIDGVAASMAAILAMASDEVVMAEESFLMVHPPWALVIGNAEEMRGMADTLDKVDENHLSLMARKSGQTPQDLRDMIGDELWLNAEEATDIGFADRIDGQAEAEARFDLSLYNHVPARLQGKNTPATKREIERLLTREAGLSRSEAAKMLQSYEVVTRDAHSDTTAAIAALTDRMRDAARTLRHN